MDFVLKNKKGETMAIAVAIFLIYAIATSFAYIKLEYWTENFGPIQYLSALGAILMLQTLGGWLLANFLIKAFGLQ